MRAASILWVALATMTSAAIPAGAAVSLGLGMGSMGFGLGLDGGPGGASGSQEVPTGFANTFYATGNLGWRLMDPSDAVPYYDLGQYHLAPKINSQQGALGGLALGFLWRRGISLDLGMDIGPYREFNGDIVHQTGVVRFEDYHVFMDTRTWYAQAGIQWLIPFFAPRHWLLVGLGGRLGLSEMSGSVSILQNFPSDPSQPREGGHDVASRAFSQALVGQVRWLVTPWLSLDLSAMYENMIFTRVELKNGSGYLKGIEKTQPYDSTGTGAPMVWNFSGPSFRAGLSFFFKTPVAALRAPELAKPVGEEARATAEKQRQSGDALLKASLLPEAMDAYLSATRLDPGNAAAWHGLGNGLFKLKRYEDAARAYEKALALDPDNQRLAGYLSNLKAWLMRKNGTLSR